MLTKEEQLRRVKEDGLSVRHIENPDKDVLLAAVEQSDYSIDHIDNPCDDAILIHKALW